jgi:DNA uptake protein ComE-like DNA-binding protein
MRLGRYLAAAALSALLAAPVAAQTTSSSPSTNRPSTTAPHSTSRSGTAAETQQRQGAVDSNSASAEELHQLPGIGSKRAQAIIDNRPYKSKDQLVEKKVLPENVYAQIKDRIVARQGTATRSSGSSRPPSSTTKSK